MRKNSAKQWAKLQASPEGLAKIKARRIIGVLRRFHGLAPEPCKVCGAERSTAHHVDYSQPFLVAWLCYLHHAQADKGIIAIPAEMLTILEDKRDPLRVERALNRKNKTK